MSIGSARAGVLGWSLAGLCAVLIALIWYEVEQGGLPHPSSAPGEAANAKPDAQPIALQSATFALPPLQQYSEIVERTLFDASRRSPPEEPDEMPAAAAAELRDLTLTGVVITPETKVALFRDKTPTQVVRLEPGGAFGKWLLVDVRHDGVTMRRGTTTRDLLLYEGDDPLRSKTAAQAPAAQSPAAAQSPPAVQSPRVVQSPTAAQSRAAGLSQGGAQPPTPTTRVERRAARRALRGGDGAPRPAAPDDK